MKIPLSKPKYDFTEKEIRKSLRSIIGNLHIEHLKDSVRLDREKTMAITTYKVNENEYLEVYLHKDSYCPGGCIIRKVPKLRFELDIFELYDYISSKFLKVETNYSL